MDSRSGCVKDHRLCTAISHQRGTGVQRTKTLLTSEKTNLVHTKQEYSEAKRATAVILSLDPSSSPLAH